MADVGVADTYSNKVCVLSVPDGNYGVYFFDQLLLLVVIEVHVPLSQAGLTRSVLYQNEPDL